MNNKKKMKRLKPEVGIKNVIKIDGKNMKKAAWTCRVHGVTRVIRVRPRVGPEKLFHSHAQKYFIQRKKYFVALFCTCPPALY